LVGFFFIQAVRVANIHKLLQIIFGCNAGLVAIGSLRKIHIDIHLNGYYKG